MCAELLGELGTGSHEPCLILILTYKCTRRRGLGLLCFYRRLEDISTGRISVCLCGEF